MLHRHPLDSVLPIWLALAVGVSSLCGCADDAGRCADGAACAGDGGTAPPPALEGTPPSTCGASLGEGCAADADCDVGLSCRAGTCACLREPCTLACFETGTPDRLRSTNDSVLFLLADRPASWALLAVRVADGPPVTVTDGAGVAELAVYAERAFLAHQADEAGVSELEEMAIDGSDRRPVADWRFSSPTWLAVGETEIVAARVRLLARSDRTGSPMEELASGLGVNFPTWLTLAGREVFWVNDNVDRPQDQLLSVSLDDGTTQNLSGSGHIRAMNVCDGVLYWSNEDTLTRLDLATRVDESVGPGTRALACDGRNAWAFGVDNSTAPSRRTLRFLPAEGAEERRLAAAGDVLAGESLAVVGGSLVWTTRAGGPWRVLRMAKP